MDVDGRADGVFGGEAGGDGATDGGEGGGGAEGEASGAIHPRERVKGDGECHGRKWKYGTMSIFVSNVINQGQRCRLVYVAFLKAFARIREGQTRALIGPE